MTEDCEQLTVIPKKYEILVQKRVKYRCNCQGCIVTANAPARIVSGSSYSDEMILDVALSKYCDLIPIERYAAMAGLKNTDLICPIDLLASSANHNLTACALRHEAFIFSSNKGLSNYIRSKAIPSKMKKMTYVLDVSLYA